MQTNDYTQRFGTRVTRADTFDIVPDFIPFLGYADDAIVVAIALRSVARRAGPDAIEEHWPGTPEGLHAVRRLIGLPTPPEA